MLFFQPFRSALSTCHSHTALTGNLFACVLCSGTILFSGFCSEAKAYDAAGRHMERSRPTLRARPGNAQLISLPARHVVAFEPESPKTNMRSSHNTATRVTRTEVTIKPLQYYNRPKQSMAQREAPKEVKVIYAPPQLRELPVVDVEAVQPAVTHALPQKTVIVLPPEVVQTAPVVTLQNIAVTAPSTPTVLPWLSEQSKPPRAEYQTVSAVQRIATQPEIVAPSIDVSVQPVIVPAVTPAHILDNKKDKPFIVEVDPSQAVPPVVEIQEATGEIASPARPLETLPPVAPTVQAAPLSNETQEILHHLPRDIFPEPRKPNTFDVERSKQEVDISSEVEGTGGIGASVAVRRQAIDINYELEKAYNALLRGNTEVAISVYQDILAAEPRNQHALFGLATTYHKLGFLEKARPLYGTLLEIDPYNKETLNNFLALVGEEAPESAIRYLEQLKGQNSDFSPIYAQLAQLYLKDGNTMLAIENMQEAVAMSPDNLIYKYNLAVLYDNAKEPGRAIVLYRQLIKAGLDGAELPANLRDIQERLTFLSSN